MLERKKGGGSGNLGQNVEFSGEITEETDNRNTKRGKTDLTTS